MSSQAGISPGGAGEHRIGRDHAELLLARERELALRVPAVVNWPLYLSDHSGRT